MVVWSWSSSVHGEEGSSSVVFAELDLLFVVWMLLNGGFFAIAEII